MPPMVPHVGEQPKLMSLAFSVAVVGRSADRSMRIAIIPESALASAAQTQQSGGIRNNQESGITALWGEGLGNDPSYPAPWPECLLTMITEES